MSLSIGSFASRASPPAGRNSGRVCARHRRAERADAQDRRRIAVRAHRQCRSARHRDQLVRRARLRRRRQVPRRLAGIGRRRHPSLERRRHVALRPSGRHGRGQTRRHLRPIGNRQRHNDEHDQHAQRMRIARGQRQLRPRDLKPVQMIEHPAPVRVPQALRCRRPCRSRACLPACSAADDQARSIVRDGAPLASASALRVCRSDHITAATIPAANQHQTNQVQPFGQIGERIGERQNHETARRSRRRATTSATTARRRQRRPTRQHAPRTDLRQSAGWSSGAI